MPKETASHINQLVATNPDGADPKTQGDDHIRMIKSVLLTDFPNIAGAVTADHTELSYCDGVTSAIQTQLNAKAPLASPALTGVPTVPTAAADTNTTQAASTAFVLGQVGTASPAMNGVATVGASLRYARQDHIHPIDTSRAPLASPALTGTPTTPTAATGTNTTQIASTAFVQAQIASTVPNADTTTIGKVRYSTNTEARDLNNNFTALTPYSCDQAFRGTNQGSKWQRDPGGRYRQWLVVNIGDIGGGYPGNYWSASFLFSLTTVIHINVTVCDWSNTGAIAPAVAGWDGSSVWGYVAEWSVLTQNITLLIEVIGE